MTLDLSSFQETVRALLATAPQGRLLLGSLGTLLPQRLPGFQPANFGATTLKALLARCPEVGTVARGRSHGDVWLVAPNGEPPPADGASPPGEQPRRQGRLRPDWWQALVRFDKGSWLDLEKMTLTDQDPGTSDESERFLMLPHFSLDEQRRLAREFTEKQEPESRDRLLRALDQARFMKLFLLETERLGCKQAWSELRVHTVIAAAEAWAAAHDLSWDLLFEPWGGQPPRQVPASPPASPHRESAGPLMHSMDTPTFRQFLHQIVDDMTEAELMQVPIPGRFLLRRGA